MNVSDTSPKRAGAFLCCVLVWSAAFALAGCRTRTIYVPEGEPVRIRQTIRGASVWIMDAQGEWIAGTVDLPEGWYALPDPGPASE